jgi:rhodanese-related sulfurtransferase
MIEKSSELRILVDEDIHLITSSKLQPLAGPQLLEEQRNGALVLDVRAPAQFVSFHIRGALQIGLVGPFASWAAMLIALEQRLVLVAEDIRRVDEAHTRLVRVGLKHVLGYSLADEMQWLSEGIDVASIPTRHCAAIQDGLQGGSSKQLIDVRSQAEWLTGHLPGAITVPLLDLASEAQNIDRSRPSLIYCHEGYRATTAASILLLKSSGDVGILIDGIEGWSALGLTLETPSVESSTDSAVSCAQLSAHPIELSENPEPL